ncbi:PHP domain-containing protein [bacterium]|nr:PHP domain-containing protein [bacterium]
MVREQDYVSIHTHTDGSHNDGIISCDKLCEKASLLGQRAVALTDHNSLAAFPRFITAANKHDIKPILGSEFYFVKNAQQSIQTKDNERFHLVVIAKNDQGLQNLIMLHNQSWTKNYFRMHPRSVERGLLDVELLSRYSEGLIITTACYYGGVPQYLFTGATDNALSLASELKDLFGEDLYFEVADHFIPDETKAFEHLIEFAGKMEVKVVAAQDAHYLNKEDAFAQELLIGTRFGYYSGFKFPNDQFYFKSAQEMSETGLKDEYIINTSEIAEKVGDYSWDYSTPKSEEKTLINGAYSKTLTSLDALSRFSMFRKVPSAIFYAYKNLFKEGDPLDTILVGDPKIRKYFEKTPLLEHTVRTLSGVEVGLLPRRELFAAFNSMPPEKFPLERMGIFLISQWAFERE